MRLPLLIAVLCSSALSAQAKEPMVLPKQSGWVGAVAFSPDGRTLAVGSGDGNVTLWDASAGKKLATLRSHKDAVAALAWSPDGTLLVSGGHDYVALLHQVSGTRKTTGAVSALTGHTGAVMSAVFAVDGKRLFTGSIDATIREWDVAGLSTTKILRDHTSWVNGLAIDRTGKMLASAGSDNWIVVRGVGGRPENTASLGGPEGEIRAVAFAPDGKRVAAGIRYGNVRVWALEKPGEDVTLKAHAGETWAVAFTPDGKTLASAGGDWNKPGEVRLWDTVTWKERAALKHTGEVLCLSISSDGKLLAAGSWDRTVRVWELGK